VRQNRVEWARAIDINPGDFDLCVICQLGLQLVQREDFIFLFATHVDLIWTQGSVIGVGYEMYSSKEIWIQGSGRD
jgi:hypothetical protein